jgi:uncharacterized protein YneF (UPF0154 family)
MDAAMIGLIGLILLMVLGLFLGCLVMIKYWMRT